MFSTVAHITTYFTRTEISSVLESVLYDCLNGQIFCYDIVVHLVINLYVVRRMEIIYALIAVDSQGSITLIAGHNSIHVGDSCNIN